jgi:hypothetical protein
MTPLRRYSPPLAALAFALCPLFASAQLRSDALDAADPQSPVTARPQAAPATPRMTTPELPSGTSDALSVWQRANQDVAAFPRGHIDILRWETGQPNAPTPVTSPASARPLGPDEALRASLAQQPALFTLPGMNALEQTVVQRALLAHTLDVQRAWITAVATRAALRHQQARLDAAQSGAELGRRMVVAGNWSQARLLREQLTLAREQAALLRAQQTAMDAQEQLARLMGQWRAQTIEALMQRLPEQLPAPPATLQPGPGLTAADIETAALRSHPTLTTQRAQTQRELVAVTPVQRNAWDDSVRGMLGHIPADGWPSRGMTITDRRLTGNHALERAVDAEADLLQLATERRSAARTAWARLQTAHALARHTQDVTLPLQTALEQETQRRYNGMLQSTWELLEASRERMQAASDAASARRDFWLAQADWQALLAGGDYAPASPSPFTGSASTATSTAGH